jgi:uncharacterized protein (DUF433 family)
MATAPKATYAHIVKRPGYCGGKAAIDNTRVRVNNVVFLHNQGKNPEEIRVTYPDLSLAQVHAALAYYYDHKEEIEAELAADADWADEHEREKAEHLSRRPAR